MGIGVGWGGDLDGNRYSHMNMNMHAETQNKILKEEKEDDVRVMQCVTCFQICCGATSGTRLYTCTTQVSICLQTL